MTLILYTLLLFQDPAVRESIKFDLSTITWPVIVGSVTIVVTLFGLLYFEWWRNRRRLSYDVIISFDLVSADTAIRDKVEIKFDGVPVEYVRAFVLKVINDGFQPIKKAEFEKPIRFVFEHNRIITAEKVEFHPENLGTLISYGDNWVEIEPALFNRKDLVEFKVLLDGYHRPDLKVDARIEGVVNLTHIRRVPGLFLGLVCGGRNRDKFRRLFHSQPRLWPFTMVRAVRSIHRKRDVFVQLLAFEDRAH
jgi:hypothetical protein